MQQLELDFESAIALARQDPVQMELFELLEQLRPSLEGLGNEETLRVAGQRFLELAEVLEQKAEVMLGDWCDRHNDEGPIPDEDFLAGLVQESMFLDVSEMVRQPKGRRKVEPEPDSIDSTASEMDKTELLALLEGADVEVDSPPTFSVEQLEHDENVADWIEQIRTYMAQLGNEEITFSDLWRKQKLPLGKAWLAVLLGGFSITHHGDFYSGILRIRFPSR